MPKVKKSQTKQWPEGFVTARQRKKEGSFITAMLKGKRGAGKSRFLIDLHKMNVEDAFKKLYREDLDWSDYDYDKVAKASEHCLMLVIDYDLEGQEKLIENDNLMPDVISDSWIKFSVVGSPLDSDDYHDRYEEGLEALKYCLHMLQEHHDKYPNYSHQRVLIVEDLGELYDTSKDHFFNDSTHGQVKTFREQFTKTIKKKIAQGKPQKGEPGVALFPLGQRDTFGKINMDYKYFAQEAVRYKRVFGYSVYFTTRIATVEKEDKATKKKWTEEFAVGRTYLLEGYFDLIVQFDKLIKTNGDSKKSHYFMDTFGSDEDIGKNRLSDDFMMNSPRVDIARAFFNKLRSEMKNVGKVIKIEKSNDKS